MKTNHVFISYSRDQFYFAEFLALRLQKQGVSTWFDMQRLTPGVSWQDLIESGLSSCIGLVLIASKSAFASDYVRNEWQLVLAAKKPIYIVLFETVSIPSELQNATIIDMRSAFNSKIDVLVKTIRTGATYRDPLPRISRLPFPMRLPPAIWFVACALSIGTIAYISMMLLFLIFVLQEVPLLFQSIDKSYQVFHELDMTHLTLFSEFFLVCLMFLTTAIVLFPLISAFLFRRKTSIASTTVFRLLAFSGLLVIMPVLMVLIFLQLPVKPPIITQLFLQVGDNNIYVHKPFFVLLTFVFASAFFVLSACFVMGNSAAVLRWYSTGSAPEKLRMKWNPIKKRLSWQALIPIRTKERTFRLYYDSIDERVAQDVRDILQGHRAFRESKNGQAGFSIALINNRTSQAWINDLARTIPGLICIATTCIRLPQGERALLQQQWVDYRLHTRSSLEAMHALLNTDISNSMSYDYPATPESLEVPVYPKKVGRLADNLIFFSSFAFGFGFANLLMGGVSAFLFNGALGNPLIFNCIALLNVLLGVLLVELALKFVTRTITPKVFWILTSLTFISWSILALFSEGQPIVTGVGTVKMLSFGKVYELSSTREFMPGGGPMLAIIFSLILIILFYQSRRSVEYWLPKAILNPDKGNSTQKSAQILQLPIWRLFPWNLSIILSLFIIWGFLIFLMALLMLQP